MPEALATGLGVQEQPGRPIAVTVADYLAVRQLLLVLDNCEHLIMACALLVEELLRAAPGLRILATSREALRAEGETVWRVPSLSTPRAHALPAMGSETAETLQQYEAARLFVDRARAALPTLHLTDENAETIGQICRQLDGIPLAIEVAAARAGALSLEQLAAQLTHHFRLRIGGRRTALPRHQTLHAAIDWSYELLSDEERVLLRRLSVFAGGWTLEAARAVCGGSGSDTRDESAGDDMAAAVLDLLLELVEKSLVQVAGGRDAEPRYHLLEMLRQYGLERLHAAGEASITRRRHLEWFADLAERCRPGIFGPDGADSLDRLAAELDNFRAAMTWSLTSPAASDTRSGLSIAVALQQLWLFRDHLAEGERWLTQTLAANRARASYRDRPGDGRGVGNGETESPSPTASIGTHGANLWVRALIGLSVLLRSQGKQDQGTRSAQDALALARAVDDPLGEAHATVTLGNIAQEMGEYEQAIESLDDSLATFRRLGDAFGTWRALSSLGNSFLALGQADRARDVLEEGLTVTRSMGFAYGVALQLRRLGVLAFQRSDLERATALLEESLVWSDMLDATRARNESLLQLGRVVLAAGDTRRAAELFSASLLLSDRAGDRGSILRCLEGLAAVAVACESEGGAVRGAWLLGAAASIRRVVGVPLSPGEARTIEVATAALRERLGVPAFEVAWSEGSRMLLGRVVTTGHEFARSLQAGETAHDATDGRSAPAAPPTSRAPLSPREREVAALVADGLSNRQIATALVIGERTVQSHVASILARLELRNRAQIAAWALQHGLVAPSER